MDEKKSIKVSLSTVFLIIAIIAIIIMGIYIYRLNSDKTAEIQKSTELQTQVNNLNGTVSQLQGKLDSISNTLVSSTSNNSTKELTDSEKQELFNKAIKEQTVLIDDMVLTKDFSQKNFTDKEIILLLPDSSEGKIFSDYEDNSADGYGFWNKASISDVEESAKKLFGKTINVKSAQNNDSIRIINDNVVVEVRSGVGVTKDELISVKSTGENEYIIEFKHISDKTETYKLTVNYENGNVIYIGFEK